MISPKTFLSISLLLLSHTHLLDQTKAFPVSGDHDSFQPHHVDTEPVEYHENTTHETHNPESFSYVAQLLPLIDQVPDLHGNGMDYTGVNHEMDETDFYGYEIDTYSDESEPSETVRYDPNALDDVGHRVRNPHAEKYLRKVRNLLNAIRNLLQMPPTTQELKLVKELILTLDQNVDVFEPADLDSYETYSQKITAKKVFLYGLLKELLEKETSKTIQNRIPVLLESAIDVLNEKPWLLENRLRLNHNLMHDDMESDSKMPFSVFHSHEISKQIRDIRALMQMPAEPEKKVLQQFVYNIEPALSFKHEEHTMEIENLEASLTGKQRAARKFWCNEIRQIINHRYPSVPLHRISQFKLLELGLLIAHDPETESSKISEIVEHREKVNFDTESSRKNEKRIAAAFVRLKDLLGVSNTTRGDVLKVLVCHLDNTKCIDPQTGTAMKHQKTRLISAYWFELLKKTMHEQFPEWMNVKISQAEVLEKCITLIETGVIQLNFSVTPVPEQTEREDDGPGQGEATLVAPPRCRRRKRRRNWNQSTLLKLSMDYLKGTDETLATLSSTTPEQRVAADGLLLLAQDELANMDTRASLIVGSNMQQSKRVIRDYLNEFKVLFQLEGRQAASDKAVLEEIAHRLSGRTDRMTVPEEIMRLSSRNERDCEIFAFWYDRVEEALLQKMTPTEANQ